MPLISTTTPADGQAANAASVDTPLNAIINVINGGLDNANIAAGGITNANLAGGIDVAKLAADALTGWTPLGQTLTYGSNNGGKEFTVTAPADLTSILSPGMRMKVTRATTPPTQSMKFIAGSTQYATKASPSGVTDTGDFTTEAWIKLSSYTGQAQYIINKFPTVGDAGFVFFVNSAAQPAIQFGNASNVSDFNSSASLPLNTWVHVAAAVSVSAATCAFYLNGALATSASTSTSATTRTQAATDLRLGAAAGGTLTNTYFDGEMSEVRLWSVAQSSGSIQANMAVNLVGNESNLVALFKGNGNFTDTTANANTLTASGAIATQADNPYNLIEYANVLAVSYSNPTTTITLKTGNYGTIPNMTLSNPFYSIQSSPLGFPIGLKKVISAQSQIMANFVANSNGSNVSVPGLSVTLTVPVNAGKIKIIGYVPWLEVGAGSPPGLNMQLVEGSTILAGAALTQGVNGSNSSPFVTLWQGYPSAGSHTYFMQMYCNQNSNLTLAAGTTFPAFIEVVED